MTFRRLALAAPLLLLTACTAPPHAAKSAAEIAELTQWMTGSFSSAEQARLDPENFFDISLVMQPIWTEREDGAWLYVEQAAAEALAKPYRQRVYRLVETEAGLRSEVYELPGDPLEFAGAYATPERFDALAPDDLSERTGCAIELVRLGNDWVGATADRSCPSSLGGASYATSEVTITPTVLTSWDRGFDEDGEQVWGAELGPYRFVKLL